MPRALPQRDLTEAAVREINGQARPRSNEERILSPRNDEAPVGRGFRKRAGDRDRTGDVQLGELPHFRTVPHGAAVAAAADTDPEPARHCGRIPFQPISTR